MAWVWLILYQFVWKYFRFVTCSVIKFSLESYVVQCLLNPFEAEAVDGVCWGWLVNERHDRTPRVTGIPGRSNELSYIMDLRDLFRIPLFNRYTYFYALGVIFFHLSSIRCWQIDPPVFICRLARLISLGITNRGLYRQQVERRAPVEIFFSFSNFQLSSLFFLHHKRILEKLVAFAIFTTIRYSDTFVDLHGLF